MVLAIFNPEHDLCLAKGRANYIPPRSALNFANTNAGIMKVLYPDAFCCSAEQWDNSFVPTEVVVWGWDTVVRQTLLKKGILEELLPSINDIIIIRELQHRATILPLQPDCYAITSIPVMETLLQEREHWVMKAPWSGAGRGLRWVHGHLTDIDKDWLKKTAEKQCCVIVEPRRDVVIDFAFEYNRNQFIGYSLFSTQSGVYRRNEPLTDIRIIEQLNRHTDQLQSKKKQIDDWLQDNVAKKYCGPLGVDMMIDNKGRIFVSEINFRHTMGMVAHQRINNGVF